ncbi:hypothetical protein [Maridesulfovibrio bastinii]|uniref:hypothetical protein n=1 Tax=Maridesulfovibrio bastinii TaxID=47157 RepID=UPI0003FFC269|nr:hypothetical protein [Maridesulfovibrio bastinii]
MSEGIVEIEEQLDKLEDPDNFIGFCAFDLFLDNNEQTIKEGMVKISRNFSGEESGFLRFTFIIDVYGNNSERSKVQQIFSRFHDASLSSDLDPDFMYVKPTEPKTQKDQAWFIGDVFFNFDKCRDAAKENVINFFIPFLTLRLPVEFHDLQWWDDEATDECPCKEKSSAIQSIKNFIKKRFS